MLSTLYVFILMSSRIARKLKTVQYRLRSLRTPQNLFDRMKNCIERVELSFGFAVRVFVLVGSVFTSRYLRPSRRKSKRPADYAEIQVLTAESTGEDLCIESEEERTFKHNVFFVIVACVIAGLTTRYVSANSINNLFCFLWQYLELSEDQILEACNVFGKKYANDVSKKDLKEEMLRLKAIHSANFGNSSLPPFELFEHH